MSDLFMTPETAGHQKSKHLQSTADRINSFIMQNNGGPFSIPSTEVTDADMRVLTPYLRASGWNPQSYIADSWWFGFSAYQPPEGYDKKLIFRTQTESRVAWQKRWQKSFDRIQSIIALGAGAAFCIPYSELQPDEIESLSPILLKSFWTVREVQSDWNWFDGHFWLFEPIV
jgi:hypothetical protein